MSQQQQQVEALVSDNLPLVKWAVSKWVPKRWRRQEADWQHWYSLVQVELVRAAADYDPRRGRFISFFGAYARNAICIEFDRLNARKRRGCVLYSDLEANELEDTLSRRTQTQTEQERSLLRKELRAQAESLLSCQRLNSRQQLVGRLVWLDGWTKVEVAAKTGLTYKQVRAAYNGAVTALKKEFR